MHTHTHLQYRGATQIGRGLMLQPRSNMTQSYTNHQTKIKNYQSYHILWYLQRWDGHFLMDTKIHNETNELQLSRRHYWNDWPDLHSKRTAEGLNRINILVQCLNCLQWLAAWHHCFEAVRNNRVLLLLHVGSVCGSSVFMYLHTVLTGVKRRVCLGN